MTIPPPETSLVARLRAAKAQLDANGVIGSEYIAVLCVEAADLIERLTAPMTEMETTVEERAALVARLRQILVDHSSPTIGRGDIHGGQAGNIVYEREWPIILPRWQEILLTAQLAAANASRDALQAAGTRALIEKDELAARVQRVQDARIAALEAALKTLRSLVREGGVPRYTVTPGAALNSVIEEIVDPVLRAALTPKET